MRLPAPKARPSSLHRQRVRSAWLFLSPVLFILALVAGWPLLRTFYFAFTNANLSDPDAARFVAFGNFARLLVDPKWWGSVWNTSFFTIVSVVLETILGMVVALTLHSKFRGLGLMRAAVLVPWAVPTIVSARMWGWMFNDIYGVINAMLLWVGILDRPLAWMANPSLSMAAVIAVDVWKTTPFMALMLLAALQLLPDDVYEAAKIDGSNPIRTFFKITLPMIQGPLAVAVIFRSLDALRVFDVFYVLTSNSSQTMPMAGYARQQMFEFQEMGYGSAASTLLFIIIALFTVGYFAIAKVKLDEEA
jgi:trehalose/maltose transport system permease protein